MSLLYSERPDQRPQHGCGFKTMVELQLKHMGCACSGLWQLTNQNRLSFLGTGVLKETGTKMERSDSGWIEVLQQCAAGEHCKDLLIDTPQKNDGPENYHSMGLLNGTLFPALCACCSPLSFFDLLLEGTCFFFKVWAWACSLHRRSWKLINFHIMKAWVRQMAASTVILIERGESQQSKKKSRHKFKPQRFISNPVLDTLF